jgi:SSS family solute:Na+ symporter
MIVGIVAVVVVACMALALLAGRIGQGGGISEYLVGGRSFAPWLVYFLAVGEVYSIGSMLGFPSGVYAEGASSAVWFMGYIVLAYPIGYFVAPLVWRAGRRYNAMTVPELFGRHFGSRGLEITTGLVTLFALIPWGLYQFVGLQAVLSGLGLQLSTVECVVIAGIIGFLYVAVSGVRSPAFVSMVKDALLVIAVVAVGCFALYKAGGTNAITGAHAVPLPSVTLTGGQLTDTITTIVYQAVAFYLVFASSYIFPARSEKALKSSVLYMPLYMLMFPFLVFAAYWAKQEYPHLANPNMAFLTVARGMMPDWLLGVVAAGAALSGLLVLSVTATGASGVVTRTLIRNADSQVQARRTKMVVALFMVIAGLLCLYAQSLMITLLALTYIILGQVIPAWVAVLWFRRIPSAALACGMVVGVALGASLHFAGLEPLHINDGLLGIVANCAIVAVWTLIRPAPAKPAVAALGHSGPAVAEAAGSEPVPAGEPA